MNGNRGQLRHPDRFGQELDVFGRMDPFMEMHQLMNHRFGGGIFGDIMGRGFRDPFEEMMSFSDAHKNIHKGNNGGSYVCQTFVSSSKMGEDGRIYKQQFYENSAGQNRNGQTISQKQQAYKNNTGVDRIAEERMLNDRGRKIVKERKGGEIQQTNHYYNMDEQEVGRFDQDWRGADRQIGFLEGLSKGNRLMYQQQRQQPRITFNQQQERERPREHRQEKPREIRYEPKQSYLSDQKQETMSRASKKSNTNSQKYSDGRR